MSKKKKDPKFAHTVNLIVGDWSDNGHGKTETFTVNCNLDKKALEKAYKAGVKKTQVDLTKDVATNFEDNSISRDAVDKLGKHGFKISDHSDDVPYPDEIDCEASLWSDGFATTWLFIARVGNPELEYEFVVDNTSTINIGGYGLFID